VRAEIDKRAMAALSSGHLAVDFSNGALPALLPFLVDRFDLSYTLAGVVILASTVSSSVIQPVFGLWSDRRGAIWLLPGGVALAGIGIALAAASPAYGLVLFWVVVSGIGVAAYHPEGSKFAAYVSGHRRASGMSLFSVGGNLGFAGGAIVATPLVLWLGLNGGLLLAVPCLAVAALLVATVPFLTTFVPGRESRKAVRAARDRPGSMALLLGVITFRSVAWFGLVTFVPLWEVSLGHSKAHGNQLLALMLLAGVVGTLAAGPAADRFGRRVVLMISLVATPPLTLVFVLVGGVLGAVALALVGVCVIGTFGVTMVMSQEYLPRHIGMASGLSIGLSIGLGGVAAVGLGALADAVDLRTALYACAAAPVIAVLLGALLPADRGRRGLAPELAAP
jgi:FSR family fosmidomycin resistance protein-like MFS transporter